jgi:predicted cupin superfamily sugar epimerase
MPPLTAAGVVARLRLAPHPEGGYFRETFRDSGSPGRAASTAIYYLLAAGQRSHWHRVDAAEVWHWYGGAPLRLDIADDRRMHSFTLGNDILAGQEPQLVVPAETWQAAESLGAWSLVGCTVAPGFEFAGFTVAPAGWSPPA